MEIRETRRGTGWKVELFDGERSISWCSLADCRMRIGESVVAMGGIGGVGTLPEFRRKGLSRQVMEATIAMMERERYAISFLHGIQEFYHRFGFITCMAEHEFSLDTRDAERCGRGAKTRRLKTGDLPSVARLYNRDNAARTGSAVRDPRHWRGFPKGTWWSNPAATQVVVDGRDRIIGYVVYDDVRDCCRAAEVGGRGESVFAAILGVLARRAVKLRLERVRVHAPADHPFAIYCREFGLRIHSLYPRNERCMGRIIDFRNCIESVIPTLARRWGRDERGLRLCIRTDAGGGTLGWQGEQLVFTEGLHRGCARLNQEHLMQLLMGYLRPSDLAGLGRMTKAASERNLIERLFPLQHAQLWWPDRF